MTVMVLSQRAQDKKSRASLKSILETMLAQLPAIHNIESVIEAYADEHEVFNPDCNGWKAFELTGHRTFMLKLSFDMAVKKGPRKKKVSKK